MMYLYSSYWQWQIRCSRCYSAFSMCHVNWCDVFQPSSCTVSHCLHSGYWRMRCYWCCWCVYIMVTDGDRCGVIDMMCLHSGYWWWQMRVLFIGVVDMCLHSGYWWWPMRCYWCCSSLQHVQCPMLMLHAEDDRTVPLDLARKVGFFWCLLVIENVCAFARVYIYI